MLWSGKVADDAETDISTQAIRDLNNTIHNNTRVENCIISISDGINLVRKP